MSTVTLPGAPDSISLDVSTVAEYIDLAWSDVSIPRILVAAESLVRRRGSEAVALWPATAGLRPQILLLAKRAGSLIDGPTSRLARALSRGTPQSLRLDAEPLMSALRACASLDAQIHELCEAARLVSVVNGTFDRLEREYSADVPRAWSYWTKSHAVDRYTISRAQSAEELNNIARWLDQVERELAAWRGDIREWLGGASAIPSGDEADPSPELSAPMAVLEYRYEILIKLGAADRAPSQERSAVQIRDNVRAHLLQLAFDAVIGRDDGMLRIAEDYAAGQHGAPMSCDEIGTYILALDHYSVSWRNERARGETGV